MNPSPLALARPKPYLPGMPKRSSRTGTRDVNRAARAVLDAATAERAFPDPPPGALAGRYVPGELTPDGKNPAAVMLGRLGGLVGGKARAAKLSGKKRSQIAKRAAKARWAKK